LATAEFAFNNKVCITTKLSLFKVNYSKELRMGFEIRKKGKNVKAEDFVKKMKKIYKKAKVVLRKSQKEINKYMDRNKKEAVEYKEVFYYTGHNGSPCLQEELYTEYQYPNLFI